MRKTIGKPTGARLLKGRLIAASLAALLVSAVLIGRLYQLQILKGEEYRAKSIGNFVIETNIPSDRGMILDANGTILVDSRPSYNVTLTPAFCQPPGAPKRFCEDEVLPRVSLYLQLTDEELSRVVQQLKRAKGLSRFRDFVVKIDADLDALDRLDANKLELPGVEIVAAPHRNYRYGPLAAHTLGYMNEVSSDELERQSESGAGRYRLGDYIGRRGVERAFEGELRGVDGARKAVVDAKGRRLQDSDYLIEEADRVRPPSPGKNVVLSIDLALQRAAERAFTADAGALAAVDVNTGFILALVSRPAYDPNILTGRISRAQLRALSEDPLEPLIFRPVQQHYHPGSTYKVVTALAALEQGSANHTTSVTCNGGYNLGSRRWRCHLDRGHGRADLHHALAWSCDTWFYAMADRMGLEPISEMAKQLGFGETFGLELSPEVPGIVPSVAYHQRVTPGGYTKGLALNTAIGQGDSNVTPLQVAMAYAAIANGGTLYRPQVMRRIEDPYGNLIRSAAPIVVRKLEVDPAHLREVQEGLEAVVNEPGGTAYWRRKEAGDVHVAGKTGTAQVVGMSAGVRVRSEDLTFFQRDHAWFAAYAPMEKPEIAIAVLNEHGGHGGSASAPIAMAVIKEYFALKAASRAAREQREGLAPERAPIPPPPVAPPALPPLRETRPEPLERHTRSDGQAAMECAWN